jgi:hypothetical protein
MNVLIWHVHGSWTTAFVQGNHRYVVPVLPDRGPDGRGRARTWDWPASVVERTPEELAGEPIDVVILQRRVELEGLAERWLGGRRPGRDVPAVYVEHNAPQGPIAEMRHPAAERPDVVVVHVTHFNALFWDTGSAQSHVIEHGVVDPGERYTGELPRAAVVINEPGRRGRVTGTDLLPRFAEAAPIDLFGMGAAAITRGTSSAPELCGFEDLRQDHLHSEMARRRVYLHPMRWTSLGLSLIEAMHLGMPVAALATTEAPEAVPREAGVISTSPDALARALRELVHDRARATEMGRAARAHALARYGLRRFLSEWDALLAGVAR